MATDPNDPAPDGADLALYGATPRMNSAFLSAWAISMVTERAPGGWSPTL